jgi:hypothetical protein
MKKLIFGCAFLVTALLACDKLEKKALARCDDGLHNQNETDVDCGGVCAPCPNCADGLKNQDEKGVDCGGVCKPCASCSDSIQNQDETGVDCGGACGVCPTCEDGIKNQNEKGIDCGGNCEPCSAATCSTPVGNGENAYLPNNKATFSDVYFEINTQGQVEITLGFPLSHLCKQYLVTIYESTFLAMPVGETQLFTIDYDSDHKTNKCFMEVYMQMATMNAQQGGKVSVRRIDGNTFNIRFCNLTVPNVPPYTLTTTYSGNANFTIN